MSNLPHLPTEEHTHTPEELRRILTYRIRFAVTVGPSLSLRNEATGALDTTAIAAELAMRDREGLPHYIAELDGPPESRNPVPWRYCMDPGCSACMTAVSAHLLPRGPERLDGVVEGIRDALERPFRPWVEKALTAVAGWIDRFALWIDRVTDEIAERRRNR